MPAWKLLVGQTINHKSICSKIRLSVLWFASVFKPALPFPFLLPLSNKNPGGGSESPRPNANSQNNKKVRITAAGFTLFWLFFLLIIFFFLRKKIYIQICFRVETKSGSTVCLCALKSVGAAPHQLHPAGGWEPGRLPPSLPSSHGSPWKAEHKFKPFKEWLRLLLITALHGIEWFGWWWFIEVIYNMLRSVNGPHQAQSRWIKK